MIKQTKIIAITGIDLDSLAESEDSHEAIEFDVLLNDEPNTKWTDEFNIAYAALPNNIKPPAHVMIDRIRIAFLPRYDRELQNYFEFLHRVLRITNEEVAKTEAISHRGNKDAQLAAFRDALRGIQVGDLAAK